MIEKKPNINLLGAEGADPTKVRFADAPWFKQCSEEYGLIIGSGGIGSNLAFLLHSAGLNFTIMDHDEVDTVNLGAQMFRPDQIRMAKTHAIKVNCIDFLGSNGTVEAIKGKYTEDSMSNNLVFLGLDNMSTRKLAFEKWANLLEEAPPEEKDNFLLIDSRLLAEKYQIFAVTKDRLKEYEATLFNDDEVEDAPCTFKATRFASWGLCSDITAVFLNWCTNKAYFDDIREVPFSIEKTYDCFYYKTT